MSKRLGALALAAAMPLTVLAAAAASAAPPNDRPCRGEYSNGKPFRLAVAGQERVLPNDPQGRLARDYALSNKPGNGRRGETAMRVTKGAQIVLSARLSQVTSVSAQGIENQKPCPGERVSLHVRKRGQTRYAQVNNDVVTRDLGRVVHVMTADRDFRFFANFNLDAVTPGARSETVLVQTKP